MSDVGLPLRLEGIEKRYGEADAVRSVCLNVNAGEFLTLLGPSGSGKTTLLHLIAGHTAPSNGRITLGGRDVTRLPARARNIGMVFQNYALFPHMNVKSNVGYGLRVRGCPRIEIDRRVAAILESVRLSEFASRRIDQLSGGQQQRVALARALVIEPDLVLMDEPLGALDRQLRRTVQLELRHLHDKRQRTTVYVTHDQEEALILSDRIAVMREGAIEQIGSAAELYENPANAFVASFIGESNLLPAKVISIENGRARIEVPAFRSELTVRQTPGLSTETSAQLLIRPEHLSLGCADGLAAVVEERVYLGELEALALRLLSGERMWLRRLAKTSVQIGATVQVGWDPDQLQALPVNPNGIRRTI
jgi:ABC-type Fe3+/spermidine/putrescine transport system ATPase subunit